ncbi:MAG: glycoside hydrolase family 1 protein [Myxococcota bacterium]
MYRTPVGVLPDDFFFGCATSAYQIEGGIENDWAEWERQGRLHDSHARCGPATQHWERFVEDFDRLEEIGADAYRFSIEWARVEPSPGRFDEVAIQRYVRMTEDLVRRKIRPIITFLHFTHPPWFHTTCPWHADQGAPDRFALFVRRMMQALEERCQFFTVVNEPMVWLLGAYGVGVIPPGIKNLRFLALAAANLMRAYVRARHIIRAYAPDARCGIAHNVVRFAPDRSASPTDRWITHAVHHFYNHAIPEVLTHGHLSVGILPGNTYKHEIPEARGSLDFLGINYYSRIHIRFDPFRRMGKHRIWAFYDDREGQGVTDLGWEIHPRGLLSMLLDMSRYDVPLVVTENGLDDRDDTRRARYLYDHLQSVLEARRRGVDIRGYLHWSLLDNFEWLDAFEPRFGLFRVDYASQERTATKAAQLFKTIANTRMLPDKPPRMDRRPGEPKGVLPDAP